MKIRQTGSVIVLFFYLLHHFVLILVDTIRRNHSAH